MIMRVYRQVKKVDGILDVVVATDDGRILEHVVKEGGKALLTSEKHPSGTDRVHEAASQLIGNHNPEDYVVINVQGDEPFIDPRAISSLMTLFEHADTGISTLIKKITNMEELSDPNVVKVVHGKSMKALYFSRSAIPFVRNTESSDWISTTLFYKHIGIYAYRAQILDQITRLQPSGLEKSEGLEQLRWLENAYSIHVKETDYESISVDTPEDLSKITNKP